MAWPRALTDSVLPVPAGPYGLPPYPRVSAWVRVRKHLHHISPSHEYHKMATCLIAAFAVKARLQEVWDA